jgi:glycosyltransferase involved in cell wall biosynthesis
MLDQITPVILTLDEEENILRTLTALEWARRVVVVDSGSSDATCDIARRFPNVVVVVHPFHSHAEQWNFAINQATTEWVLSLDADYLVTQNFRSELQALRPHASVSGYRSSFKFVNLGRPLRGSLYPGKPVLFRKERAHYVQDGHTQCLVIDGQVARLHEYLFHDDRKSFDRWVEAQWRYAKLEARKLLQTDSHMLSIPDRLRRAIFLAPVLAPVFVLFARGAILDGWPGMHYAFQRAVAEIMLSLCLIQSRVFEKPARTTASSDAESVDSRI